MTALCLEYWKYMRLILINVALEAKALVMMVMGVCVCICILGMNEWMIPLYSFCKHCLPHCKTSFCKLCQKNQELLMGKVVGLCWKHALLWGNSPFIVLLCLPEGTWDLGLPISSPVTVTGSEMAK